MSLKTEYTHRLYEDHNCYGAFPPIQKVNIGDFGLVDGRLWSRLGNISDAPHSVPYQIQQADVGEADATLFSRGASSIALSIGGGTTVGSTPVQARGGLKIAFKNDNDFFLNMSGAFHYEMDNKLNVMRIFAERSKLPDSDPQKWRHAEWRVVTSVIACRNLTLLMSAESKSEVVLEASGSSAEIDLADASLELRIASGVVAGQKWLTKKASAGQEFTPVFGLHKINWNWPYWGTGTVQPAAVQPTADLFVVVGDGDLSSIP